MHLCTYDLYLTHKEMTTQSLDDPASLRLLKIENAPDPVEIQSNLIVTGVIVKKNLIVMSHIEGFT